MRASDFDFSLPDELVASQPPAERSASRLLVLRRATGAIEHRAVRDLPSLLPPRSLVVVNDTRVIPARLYVHKPSGGKVELLFVRPLSSTATEQRWRCLGSASKPIRLGPLLLDGRERLVVEQVDGMFVDVAFAGSALELRALLDAHGALPLPPYIEEARRRRGEAVVAPADRERYQTLFATHEGAVAAPTAGLHFDGALLAALAAAGHDTARVTLHVGPGTFFPMRTDNLDEHVMHAERWEVSDAAARQLNQARAEGRSIVAIGTTVTRTLESAVRPDRTFVAGSGETSLFIRPGHVFGAVDHLITNFHLPRSTLLVLVAALAGRDPVLAAYREAVEHRYRFYSYGDAMFIC